MSSSTFELFIKKLISIGECEWIEFKQNFLKPEDLGEYISALSNSACICNQPKGYLLLGINNDTYEIIGTTFNPHQKMCNGTQDLEFWLSLKLNPKINFKIIVDSINNKKIVLFEINKAEFKPTKFDKEEWIRVSTHKKKLSDFPDKERKIWAITSNKHFEDLIALYSASDDDVLNLLDYPNYFSLINQNLPNNKEGIISKLCEDKLIIAENGFYNITNLGAILFARNLINFEKLSKKIIRLIIYKGKNKLETIKEYTLNKGYAIEFQNIVNYIIENLPTNEIIEQALRKKVELYPSLAIRELVANTIIHQDFFEKGVSPMIEIYNTDRIEFINPGTPLVEILRFIDCSPISRNEKLVAFMRRINFCEDRGSGIDKVISSIEKYQLPAPEFIVDNNFTKVILFSSKKIKNMTTDDKIRACYQHCCLKYISREEMSNESLRKRLNISDKNYPIASRIIKDTIKKGLIKPKKETKKYIPFWG